MKWSALLRPERSGRIEVCSPGVGLWRKAPAIGALIHPGTAIGALEVLGVPHEIAAPAGAAGIVVGLARRPAVAYGDLLLVLDPHAAGAMVEREASAGASQIASSEGLVFRAPMSGRFYRRAGPGKPAFVSEGDLISAGHTVCLLEVMKTFNRLAYGGDDLPERARVKAVLPADGDDIAAGAAILELEAAS